MGLAPAARVIAEDPRLSRLLRAAHRRLEASGGSIDGVTAVLPRPTDDERLAVDRLLGIRSRSMQLRVPLVRLDAVLRERVDATLLSVVWSASVLRASGEATPSSLSTWRRPATCWSAYRPRCPLGGGGSLRVCSGRATLSMPRSRSGGWCSPPLPIWLGRGFRRAPRTAGDSGAAPESTTMRLPRPCLRWACAPSSLAL